MSHSVKFSNLVGLQKVVQCGFGFISFCRNEATGTFFQWGCVANFGLFFTHLSHDLRRSIMVYNGAFPSFLKLESSTPFQSSAWKRAAITLYEISQFEFQERKKVKWFWTAGGWVKTLIASQSLFISVSRCGCLLWILSFISDLFSPSPDFQPLVSDRSVDRRRCMNIHSHQVRMICKSLWWAWTTFSV